VSRGLIPTDHLHQAFDVRLAPVLQGRFATSADYVCNAVTAVRRSPGAPMARITIQSSLSVSTNGDGPKWLLMKILSTVKNIVGAWSLI
jgi:hypothetical protein